MKRWRIRNVITHQTVEISAPNFRAGCIHARWREEDCIGLQLKSTKNYSPIKHYVKDETNGKG